MISDVKVGQVLYYCPLSGEDIKSVLYTDEPIEVKAKESCTFDVIVEYVGLKEESTFADTKSHFFYSREDYYKYIKDILKELDEYCTNVLYNVDNRLQVIKDKEIIVNNKLIKINKK